MIPLAAAAALDIGGPTFVHALGIQAAISRQCLLEVLDRPTLGARTAGQLPPSGEVVLLAIP